LFFYISVVASAAQAIYALRVLRAHSLQGQQLWDVARATVISRLLYASPAWWGYADRGARQRLESVIKRMRRQGFVEGQFPTFAELCDKQDSDLFTNVMTNTSHVLHQLLPPIKNSHYSLRPRVHNRVLPQADE